MPGTELLLVGGQATTKKMRKVLEGQMDSDYFPVSFDYLQAELKFHALNERAMDIGSSKVSFIDTNHTSKCLAARFEEKGRKLIYMTDNELESDKPTRFDEFVEFCGDADALIHDAQYTHDTYRAHVGWGHSSVENVVKLAVESGVKDLYLFHHDPDSTDAIVSRILRDSRETAGKAKLKVHAAKEGAEVQI
jgi:ribonuclease BN (tRNA processing enzyme)